MIDRIILELVLTAGGGAVVVGSDATRQQHDQVGLTADAPSITPIAIQGYYANLGRLKYDLSKDPQIVHM
jgi:hypothetical protein